MMLTTFFELFMSGKSRMCFCGVWPCSHYHFNVLPFPLLTWKNRKIRRQKIENVNSRDIFSIPSERNRLLFAFAYRTCSGICWHREGDRDWLDCDKCHDQAEHRVKANDKCRPAEWPSQFFVSIYSIESTTDETSAFITKHFIGITHRIVLRNFLICSVCRRLPGPDEECLNKSLNLSNSMFIRREAKWNAKYSPYFVCEWNNFGKFNDSNAIQMKASESH